MFEDRELIYDYLSYVCKKDILDVEIYSNANDEILLIGSIVIMSPKTLHEIEKKELPRFYKKRKFKEQLDLL
jgi:hypothetical protein